MSLFKLERTMDDQLKQGAAAYKAGDIETAKKLFIGAVRQYPDDERAWGWLGHVSSTDQERIICLKQMIRINPHNEKARNNLLRLEGQVASINSPSSQAISSIIPSPVQPVITVPMPQPLTSLELRQPAPISSTPVMEAAQNQPDEASLFNQKTIIELLQKQNETLENLRLLIYHSIENQPVKENRSSTRIVDVDMSILSMMNLMLKWFVASIPVGLVLGLMTIILASCFAAGIGK
jgi:hypothetical protein